MLKVEEAAELDTADGQDNEVPPESSVPPVNLAGRLQLEPLASDTFSSRQAKISSYYRCHLLSLSIPGHDGAKGHIPRRSVVSSLLFCQKYTGFLLSQRSFQDHPGFPVLGLAGPKLLEDSICSLLLVFCFDGLKVPLPDLILSIFYFFFH
jgi:hypothetical protein